MSDDQKLYSTKQAAQFLGVSVRTIKRYRRDGILKPDSFGSNHTALYTEEQLVKGVTRLLERGDTFLKKQPQVVTRYQQVVTRYTQSPEKVANCYEQVEKRYTEEQLQRVTTSEEKGAKFDETGAKKRAQNGQAKKVGRRLPVPQPLVTRLLKGGTTTEDNTSNEKISSNVEVEEFYFDDDDIIVINDSFKANLPTEYKQNLTKLFGKFTVAPFGEIFATPFNSAQTLITYLNVQCKCNR